MAYEWSEKSDKILGECDVRLQHIMDTALELGAMDITIVTGHRTEREQNEKFAQNLSKVRWPNSKHNSWPSKAVDVAPWIPGVGIPWDDEGAFYQLVGLIKAAAIMEGYPIRCGADWDMDGLTEDQKFHDLGHIELVD